MGTKNSWVPQYLHFFKSLKAAASSALAQGRLNPMALPHTIPDQPNLAPSERSQVQQIQRKK